MSELREKRMTFQQKVSDIDFEETKLNRNIIKNKLEISIN